MYSNIPKLLASKKISVSELSKGTGLSRTTLTELSKSNELPQKTRIETLIKISDFLNVPLKQLFDSGEVKVDLIDHVTIISGILSEKGELIKKARQQESADIKEFPIYAGFATVKILGYEKELTLAYDAKLNRIRFEILGDADRNALLLTRMFYSDSYADSKYNLMLNKLDRYKSADCLNNDLSFLSDFGIKKQDEFLQQLANTDFFAALFKKVSFGNPKEHAPYFSLDIGLELFHYLNNFTGELRYHEITLSQFTDAMLNGRGVITQHLVKYILTTYDKTREISDREQDLKNKLLHPYD